MVSQALFRVGRLAACRPWTVIGAWLVLFVIVIGCSSAFGHNLEDSFGAPGLDSQKATDLLSDAGADRAGLTAHIVVTPLDEGTTFTNSPDARAALDQVQRDVASLPRVLEAGDPRLAPDGRVAMIRVQYPVLEELDKGDLGNLKDLAADARSTLPLRIELGGDLFFAFEQAETGVGELVGVLAAIVILLVAFGSLIAMGVPIAVALFGLGLGVSSLSLIAYLIDIPAWVPAIGSMVGLGVGIDYALFVVSRYREFLARGISIPQAVGQASATAGRAVVFAGGTVVIAILGLTVAGVPFMTAGAVGMSVIVLIMVLASVTLLPALLGLAGHRINGLRRRESSRLRGAVIGERWLRWGMHVSRHPMAYAVLATSILLALAAPALALRVGTPDDGTLPEQRTERRAYDLVADGFGPGANGPLVIAMDISRDSSLVHTLSDAIAADPGVAGVEPPQVYDAAGVAIIQANPTGGPQDADTADTIDRLRSDVIPTVLGDSPARAHIGGKTATFIDLSGRVSERLPLFVGAALLVSVLLLAFVFRSILVPIKAALVNLLSIGASFGVLVMVFQWGWGADLIGLESTVPIVPFIPMFMFAILFGLSMDYEVFLLSRVREDYVATGDSRTSVVHGIARTGRVITSAALIMICVFLGFVASNDPTTKMFGLGLAVAICLDATIVRMVLVPATMAILGNAAWWFPRPRRPMPASDVPSATTAETLTHVGGVSPEAVGRE